jgi:hypothetical protein
MKHATTLTVLLLALAALPALADSIPPPFTSFATTETVMQGFYHSSSDYDLIGSNIAANLPTNCSTAICLVFEVANGSAPRIGHIKDNTAQLWGFSSATEGGNMFGNLAKVSFNPQTDILSGVFKGREQLGFVGGTPGTDYWWHVEGTFTENLATGVGSLNMTSETFLRSATVPEPQTFIELGTGLCALAGVARRKLRTL